MQHNSFEDIAVQLVATDRGRAQFQARDIAERLARGSKLFSDDGVRPYTLEEARSAMRARDALIKELIRES